MSVAKSSVNCKVIEHIILVVRGNPPQVIMVVIPEHNTLIAKFQSENAKAKALNDHPL